MLSAEDQELFYKGGGSQLQT